MTAPKIPATVITGFLGAGKTTLIRHLLQNAEGRRIALIINEFGDLGVDGEILQACGVEACGEEDMVELANGCICCTVADDFIPAMEKLLARTPPPDHIVIETSGLALPQPLVRAFHWPAVATRVTVDGVVTVVDGPAVREGRFAARRGGGRRPARGGREARPRRSARGAVRGPAALRRPARGEQGRPDVRGRHQGCPRRHSEACERGVRVVTAANGALPAAVLLGLASGAEDKIDARPSHHELEGQDDHDHDEFESFVADVPETADSKTNLNQ